MTVGTDATAHHAARETFAHRAFMMNEVAATRSRDITMKDNVSAHVVFMNIAAGNIFGAAGTAL
jgi:hypothetical protein